MDKIELLSKIVNVLKYQPAGLWLREIARQVGAHPEQVRRIIKENPKIFEEYADLTQYNINLKFIRLRKEYQRHYLSIIKSRVSGKDV